MSIRDIFFIFLGWRTGLFFIAFLGLSLLPTLDFYNKQLFFPHQGLDFWSRWGNWDSGGYLYIAEHGYIPRLTVFFPLYPMLIKAGTFLGFSYFWSALLISHISTLIALIFFCKLVSLDFNIKTAKKALFALLIFPSSFYLGTIYSEALTLALSMLAFYFGRQQKWFLAALFAGLTASTRLIGVGVILALLFEYLYQRGEVINLKVLWQTLLGRIFTYVVLIWILLSSLSLFNNLLLKGIVSSVLELLKFPFWAVIVISLIVFAKSLLSRLPYSKLLSRNLIYLMLSPLFVLGYFYYQNLVFGSPFTFLESEALNWGRVVSFP